MIWSYAPFAILAVLLVGLGRVGWIKSATLVPPTFDLRERVYRERVIRRGAVACYIAAAFMVLGIILRAVGALG